VVVRVEKDGFVAQEKQLTVERDEIVDFELQRITTPNSIDGVYTMTLTADPSCALPPEILQRKYLARITEKAGPAPAFGDLGGSFPNFTEYENGWLLVELAGPGFGSCWFEGGFTGKREGSSMRFDIFGDPSTLLEYLFNEAVGGFCPMPNFPGWWESCSHNYLAYSGTATGTIVDGNIFTLFNGNVRLYGAQSAQCTGNHRLEFTRWILPTP
jgi:hypothetical protein